MIKKQLKEKRLKKQTKWFLKRNLCLEVLILLQNQVLQLYLETTIILPQLRWQIYLLNLHLLHCLEDLLKVPIHFQNQLQMHCLAKSFQRKMRKLIKNQNRPRKHKNSQRLQNLNLRSHKKFRKNQKKKSQNRFSQLLDLCLEPPQLELYFKNQRICLVESQPAQAFSEEEALYSLENRRL